MKLKRQKDFLITENVDTKQEAMKLMNVLYGMDERYEEEVAVSYNVDEKTIKIILENEEEVSNITKYLENNDYKFVVNNLDILIQL